MITSLRYFRLLFFNYSVKLQGEVNEIAGFNGLPDDGRDLLRKIPSADAHEPTAEDKDDDENDEYSDGGLHGTDIEDEFVRFTLQIITIIVVLFMNVVSCLLCFFSEFCNFSAPV